MQTSATEDKMDKGKTIEIQEKVGLPLTDVMNELTNGPEGEMKIKAAVLVYIPEGTDQVRLSSHNLNSIGLRRLFHTLVSPDVDFGDLDNMMTKNIAKNENKNS